MKETLFQSELLETFRRAGWWARKWPDAPISAMVDRGDGKLRFSLPKPFDLVLCSPEGRFGAIECKLVRARTFAVDDRTERQAKLLAELRALGAFTALAINFRFVSKRPPERVNRAFLIRDLSMLVSPSTRWSLSDMAGHEGIDELIRVSGGWKIVAMPEGERRPGCLS